MRTGLKFSFWILMGVLCLGSLSSADTAHPSSDTAHRQRKAKKPPLPPPLPSGPQGPLQQQVSLDAMPAMAPQVNYTDGQLTIVAPNSSLGDILRAVRKQTAAEMDIPSTATERVVTHLGPGPAREVVAELLNGSHFNYVLLGSPANPSVLARVVLIAKSGPDVPGANPQAQPQGVDQAGNMAPPPPPDAGNVPPDAPDAEAADENPDDNADQTAAAEAEQPVAPPDQPGVKTPQQMLQEMQQRQLQLQQQQPPGQPPVPGAGYPPGTPRPQPDQQ
jgi:hypothetical protein